MKINNKIPILSFTCNYHFGDNYGVFNGSSYIGHYLELPMHCTYIDENAHNVSLIFETHDIETWADWQGHEVFINNKIVGYIKDEDNSYGQYEQTIIEITMEKFKELLNGKMNFYLKIKLGVQPQFSGMADDFAWTRLDTFNCVIKPSWK